MRQEGGIPGRSNTSHTMERAGKTLDDRMADEESIFIKRYVAIQSHGATSELPGFEKGRKGQPVTKCFAPKRANRQLFSWLSLGVYVRFAKGNSQRGIAAGWIESPSLLMPRVSAAGSRLG